MCSFEDAIDQLITLEDIEAAYHPAVSLPLAEIRPEKEIFA